MPLVLDTCRRRKGVEKYGKHAPRQAVWRGWCRMTSRPWPGLVLLDLDGTLIDSVGDLHACINRVLGESGLAPLALPAVRAMIGNGVRKLVERAYAASGHALDEAALDARTERMLAIYGDHLTDHTTLMPGVELAVSALVARGIALGVVTNKPLAPTTAILGHFDLNGAMAVVIGGDSGVPRKPAADMLLLALERTGHAVRDAVMVGDSPADIDAARAAGMASVAVHGGYTTIAAERLGADRVIDSLADLPQVLAEMVPVRLA
jgi:phosphoglycolate phosphatase